MKRRRLLQAALAALGPLGAHADEARARVAAASDLQFALPELAALFERRSGPGVELSFGSSGNFARQIEQGAPFDLFLSADESFVQHLADAGRTRDAGSLYAVGRIALIVPSAAPFSLDERLDGVMRRWRDVDRFAIANPDHAPYGRAAREALQALGHWKVLEPRLVLGENISQATQYVATGAAQAGITAWSLAVAPAIAARTRYQLLPETLHRPLRQRMVLLKGARPAAVAFHDFLSTPDARRVWTRSGFAVPGPTP